MSRRFLPILALLLPLAASAQLTASDEEQALDAHNDIRSRVAQGLVFDDGTDGTLPTAADMRKLEWDEDLATVAQDWADACTPGSNTDRTNDWFQLTGESNEPDLRAQPERGRRTVHPGHLGGYAAHGLRHRASQGVGGGVWRSVPIESSRPPGPAGCGDTAG